jgi:hypothetical protein
LVLGQKTRKQKKDLIIESFSVVLSEIPIEFHPGCDQFQEVLSNIDVSVAIK